MELKPNQYDYELAQERVAKLKKFYKNIIAFLLVITIVYGIKYIRYGYLNLSSIKISIVFIIWAIVIVIQAIKLFFLNSQWEKDMIKKELKKHKNGKL